jgi:hypothetical protein
MDADLKEQIKKMEAEKLSKTLANNKVTIITADSDEGKISYNQWWILVNKKKPMRAHMKEVLKADFKGRGVGDKETQEAYDDALRAFGISI